MPKIGPYKYPNHDIETTVDLIDEASARAKGLTAGSVDEDTFQNDIIDRQGGSYARHRFSLQQYGFIERSHGADDVQITDLFIEVADPLEPSDRQEALVEAVSNVDLFVEMYENEIEPEFDDNQLRIWLNKDLNIPRDKADMDTISELRKLYEPAYQYLKQRDESNKPESEPEKIDEPVQPSGSEPSKTVPTGGSVEMEEISIGDKLVRLPKEDIEKEWRTLKATVDAYIGSLEDDED